MLEKKIELFDNEIEVIKRIDDLKREGCKEEDMYVIVDDDEDISMLNGYTGVMIKEEDDSIFDRFKSFLSGKDSITDAFNKMDLEEEYRDACYEEVQDGKILLMVNESYKSKFELTQDGIPVPVEDLEPEAAGTAVDRDLEVDDPDVELSDNMKRDLGFEVTDKKRDIATLVDEQITESDITNR